LTGAVTSQVAIVASSAQFDKKTKTYKQTVTITVKAGRVFQRPLDMILKGLASGTKLVGAPWTSQKVSHRSLCLAIKLAGDNLLKPGAHITATLRFSELPNLYTPIVMAGPARP
jgi:hypothetical protein